MSCHGGVFVNSHTNCPLHGSQIEVRAGWTEEQDPLYMCSKCFEASSSHTQHGVNVRNTELVLDLVNNIELLCRRLRDAL